MPGWKRDTSWHGKGWIGAKYHKVDFLSREKTGKMVQYKCGWKRINNPNFSSTAHNFEGRTKTKPFPLKFKWSQVEPCKVKFDHNRVENYISIIHELGLQTKSKFCVIQCRLLSIPSALERGRSGSARRRRRMKKQSAEMSARGKGKDIRVTLKLRSHFPADRILLFSTSYLWRNAMRNVLKNIFVCIVFPSLCWHIIQLYLAKRKHKLGTILKVHSSALLWTLHSPLFPSLTNFHSNLMIELCWPMHTCARTVQLNICTQFGDDFKKPFNGNFLWSG